MPLTFLAKDSLIPSVLTLYPACRAVFDQYGGLRGADGPLGPTEPIAWFANQRGVSPAQLLTELEAAAQQSLALASDYNAFARSDEFRCTVEVFMRYGYGLPSVSASPPSENASSQLSSSVWEALSHCHESHYPQANIVELGLVESVRCDSTRGCCRITLALPQPNSSAETELVEQIRHEVGAVPTLHEVNVYIHPSRPWRMERAKPEVRQRLGLDW